MIFARNGLSYTVTEPAHIDAFRAAGWDEVTSVPACLPDLLSMSKAQLIEYAASIGVKVDGRKSKENIIATIEG